MKTAWISKLKGVSELSDRDKAFLVRLVRRAYGLRLTFKCERLYLSRLFKEGPCEEKIHVSKDATVGAMLFFAKDFAKREKTGFYRKGA